MGAHTFLYQRTGGRLGHTIPGVPGKMLLLDHVGAKSGTKRTSPLLYVRDGEDLVIVASKGGFPKHPAWYHNLMANPDTTVQVRREHAPGPRPGRETGGARAPLGAGRRRRTTATTTTPPAARAARSRSSSSSRADRELREVSRPGGWKPTLRRYFGAALLGDRVAALGRDRLRRPGAGPVVAGAVDRDRRAGEEVAGRRGEVGDQPGHLLRAAGAADRDRALEVVDDHLRILGQQGLGRELAGGEGDGLDPEPRPLDGQRPHHVLDRGAGGAGVDHPRHPVVGREGDAEHLAARPAG